MGKKKKIPCHRVKLISADVHGEFLLKMVSFHFTNLPYRFRSKLPSIPFSQAHFAQYSWKQNLFHRFVAFIWPHVCQQLAPFIEF